MSRCVDNNSPLAICPHSANQSNRTRYTLRSTRRGRLVISQVYENRLYDTFRTSDHYANAFNKKLYDNNNVALFEDADRSDVTLIHFIVEDLGHDPRSLFYHSFFLSLLYSKIWQLFVKLLKNLFFFFIDSINPI